MADLLKLSPEELDTREVIGLIYWALYAQPARAFEHMFDSKENSLAAMIAREASRHMAAAEAEGLLSLGFEPPLVWR